MPIQILDFPEPLTPAALESSAQRVLIQSDEYRQLVHELRSYCNGQISGRSFLIAGHRGSGKTTLTLSAFEQILREAQTGELRMRPLMVQLLGPSLLPEADERDIAEPTRGAASAEKRLTEFENVLVQFTLALHRAVVNELAQAYRDRMRFLARRPGQRSRADFEQANACLEAPGQLALELDEYPGKARLREFWLRARALPWGLLPIPPRGGTAEKREVSNQGVNELVALCSVSEAYRRISGTIRASNKDEAAAADSAALTRETEFRGKELFGPLITLLTGGIVASGVAALKPGHLELAAVAGVLTAFTSAIVAKYSSSRSRQRSSSREELFLPNLSVATLDRVLPVLLDRVRDAGLAPVFIIDELDKVEDLSKRIPKMVKRLKKLVAEKAFFCFLTDRRYFEEMSSRNAITPHSVESTYFTNQAFITFRHTDFHSYIGELLKKPEPSPPGASSEGLQPTTDLDEEIVDHALLPYILLHAAQMHPIDLRREIASYRGENNVVTLAPGEIRSSLNRLQLLVQVAIEVLLESPEMELELERDPAFRRLAYDALYFISREWQSGAEEVRFDLQARAEFDTYLTARMITERAAGNSDRNRERSPKTKPQRARGHPTKHKAEQTAQIATEPKEQDEIGEEAEELLKPPFTKEEADFLWKKVRELAALLAGLPQGIHEQAVAKNVGSVRWPHGRFVPPVLDALMSIPDPLLEQIGETEVFRFRYYRAGRLSEMTKDRKAAGDRPEPETERTSGAKPQPDNKAFKLRRDLIKTFDSTLRELTHGTINFGTLGASFGVIRTSPAWPSVETALLRLAGPSKNYPEKDEDMANIDQFANLLKSSANTIALAIFCGSVVGSISRKETKTDGEKKSEETRKKSIAKWNEFAGLQVLSEALGLKRLREENVKAQIQHLSDEIFKQLGISKPEEPKVDSVSSIKRWRQDLESLRERALPLFKEALKITAAIRMEAWDFWRARLQQPDLPANYQAILCAAAAEGPSQFLDFPPEEMSARAWSKALYQGIRFHAMDAKPMSGGLAESAPPRWLASEALRQLGFVIDLKALMGIRLADSEDVAVNRVAVEQTKPPKRNAVILSRDGSDLENWKAGKASAAVVWHGLELDDLREWNDRERLFQLMRLELVVFDWSSWPEPGKQSSRSRGETQSLLTREEFVETSRLLNLVLPTPTDVRIPAIVPRDWKGELPSYFFPIPAPNSFDELFTIIARARTRNAPA